MSNLSELLPAGGGGKNVEFVASGTLPNGKSVILNSNGTVTAVGESAVSENIPASSEAVFNTNSAVHISVTFDPTNSGKFIIAYRDYGNSHYGTAIVGTVSGTSLSFGTSAVFNSATSTNNSVAFDPNTANKFIIAYLNHGNSASSTAIVGTVSGTSLSFGTAVVLNQGGTVETVASFDPLNSGKFIVVYNDTGNSGYGTSILGQLAATETNLTSTNFLGITDAAISSGASGSVTIKGGLKSELSSLTPNSIYYVQGNGSISTASTAPAVRIGKALSSTTLNLEFSS